MLKQDGFFLLNLNEKKSLHAYPTMEDAAKFAETTNEPVYVAKLVAIVQPETKLVMKEL
ncbi:MAG TPA: hypothetical protein PKM59_08365 [Thermodesulfobacteriota bacterium]|nr:hypothetical protein [Thermodesulfobacteriota bacterium]HNU72670.1 hypothetical protein [Thermodesulfobacteriota bacterium]